jgi:hypothetical protein
MAHIHQFLQKAFASSLSSIILPLGMIAYALARCAKANTYVETLDKHADSLHIWIRKCYEEDFKAAFERQVLKAVKKMGIRNAKLAIDYTSEPFYGKSRNFFVFNVDSERWDGEFKFAVISLINQDKTIPIMAIPVRLGDGMAKPAIDLLKYCANFLSIRYVLFDRGFYSAQLIDYLEANGIKYCMLVPHKKGQIAKYVQQTQKFGCYRHQMKYSKEKSTWKPITKIAVCKEVDDIDWIFATNMRLSRIGFVLLYKRRWRIETGFRVQDEARIKSKSTDYMTRYFYFLISCLLQLFWVIHKHIYGIIPFKRYLDDIEHKTLQDFLEITLAG